MRQRDNSHLLRVLGVAFGIAAVIGATIGQGILRSPGVVAAGVPYAWLIILLWVFGGVSAFIDSMSTVELAASIRRTGGAYAFLTRTFGRFAGLAGGIGVWLGYVGIAAFVSGLFGDYLHRLGILTTVPSRWLALALLALIAGVQAFGTRVAGASQEIVSAVKALIFVGLVVALMLAPRGAPAAAAGPSVAMTAVGVIVAIRAILGTYLGWENAAFFAEEVRDFTRAVVRATFGGIALVTAIYVLVNVAMLTVLSPQEMAGSTLVAADAAGRAFGPTGDTIMTAVSLISLISIINTSMMTFARLIYAMARDAGIPYLSHVSRNGSPQVALGFHAGLVAFFSQIGGYAILLTFSTWLMTCVAVGVNLSAVVLRHKEPALDRPYRMPLFPMPAIFALLVNLGFLAAFLYESPGTVAEATALAVVLAAAAYLPTRGAARRFDAPVSEPA
ncbi:MAG: APC family permease [Sphingomonas sp.]|uniref:APC family permease n=1 Tax=Sphingomonas sp. TaxID=28214 RepID=UPI003F806A0D